MRVLIVNTYYAPEMVGGAEHSVKKLAENLLCSGVECAVLCSGAQDEDTSLNGVPVFRRRMKKRDRVIDLAGAPKLIRLLHEIQNTYCPRNASVLNAVLDQWKPDVIHTNGIYDISPVIWHCARKRRIPVVHTLRDYSMLCPRVHNMRNGQSCSRPHIWCRAYRMVNRLCSRWVGLVTAPSQKTLSMLLQNGCFPGAEARVIVNATEVDERTQQSLAGRYGQPQDPFTLVYLGELTEKKGLRWLLDTFEKMDDPGLRLAIAGRGPLEERVLKAAGRDGRIQYKGYLNEEQIGVLLDNAHVLVCPSLWEEPFGRVVIDAYRHAMPVIASSMGAFPEIVRDGSTGVLVSADCPKQLGEAVSMYRSNRERWLKDCGNAAQELQKYSVETQIQAFVSAYQNAIRKG